MVAIARQTVTEHTGVAPEVHEDVNQLPVVDAVGLDASLSLAKS